MKTIARKSLVVIATVVALVLSTGVMDVSASRPNQFMRRESGGTAPIVVAGVTNLETVIYRGQGIGFLP